MRNYTSLSSLLPAILWSQAAPVLYIGNKRKMENEEEDTTCVKWIHFLLQTQELRKTVTGHSCQKNRTVAADGSSDKTTHSLLTRRRRTGLFVSPYLHASVRKMRKAKKHTVAATLALLLFVVAAAAFVSRGGRMHGAQSVHESGNRNDATLLLAKATGMTNSDEAKTLLEALENGTVDFEDVSSALEEDAARKAAKIKAEIEKEATRKAAEEKAAAEHPIQAALTFSPPPFTVRG